MDVIAAWPGALQAGFWGLVSGSALLLGALAGLRLRLSETWVAAVMAFGSGVLISALAFELMDEAYSQGGLTASAAGFLGGAALYVAATSLMERWQGNSGDKEDQESGTAFVVGALIDGIPESIVVGLSLLGGSAVSLVTVIAIFLSNIPEGLSGAAGMKKNYRPGQIMLLWTGVILLLGVASLLGYTAFDHASPATVAATTAVAAGGILAMLMNTMIPDAFKEDHNWSGLIAALGFLVSFTLSKLGEG
ncbi:ZIP family metal transporter [Deinococcus sp. Marseille-Q6407]|uniref:ZIP family metal transporter n=1 Tax=Deinococcus sp. Marseille-Q6407 TaxID=2969223 RepID=UPI0021BF1FCC|nr:ZIP family zinc transporter [Deinococcus sp. Marseille-Q6407]